MKVSAEIVLNTRKWKHIGISSDSSSTKEKVMKSVLWGRIASSVVIVVLFLYATFAFTQGIVTGSISGVVEDQQGAVISNANVTVTQLSTNRVFKTQTTSAGIISLPAPPTPPYHPPTPASPLRPLH